MPLLIQGFLGPLFCFYCISVLLLAFVAVGVSQFYTQSIFERGDSGAGISLVHPTVIFQKGHTWAGISLVYPTVIYEKGDNWASISWSTPLLFLRKVIVGLVFPCLVEDFPKMGVCCFCPATSGAVKPRESPTPHPQPFGCVNQVCGVVKQGPAVGDTECI